MPSTKSCDRSEAHDVRYSSTQNVFQRVELGCPPDRREGDRQRDRGAGGDQVGGVVGRPGIVAAQCGDDVGDGVAREALVDPMPLRGKRTRGWLDRVGRAARRRRRR